jgi:hypothetical protein
MRSAMLCLSLMLLFGQGPPKEPWTYRSFTSDFERVADSTSGLPMPERVKVFRSTFDKLCPGLYADTDQSQLDGRIEKALTEFPSIRSTYEQVERKFPEALAKVAMARKLAVRLYWMMRKGWDYEQVKKFGSHAGQPGHRDGVKSNIE